jgi:hypothetical protein
MDQIPTGTNTPSTASRPPALRRDGGGDGEGDAMASMKPFMSPPTKPKIVPEAEPVNMNPDIKAGDPSVSQYGLARGTFGTNC